MLCYVTPFEAQRKEKERITRLQGTEIWRRQKEENRAKMIKEKREVRDLLENYWPWGRPGGGAPNSDSVGLRNIHLEELYPYEDMKKAKRFAGVFQFGRPGGGAPHFSKSGRRQIGFKEDPALRFQWGADLRRTVDNTLRYRSRRDEQERYRKDLDALVEEKKRVRDQQQKQKLDFERQMGWTHDKTVYQLAENKVGKENQCQNHLENSDRRTGRNRKFYPLPRNGSGVELVPLIVKRRTPAVKVPLGTTDVTRGDTLCNRTAICEPKYVKDLTQQVQQKHQRLKYAQNEDAEKCAQHFHAWSNFWGRPGNGAPKSSTKKGRLMHMLYPQGHLTSKEIKFTVQGELHTVNTSNDITPTTTLNSYLRDYAGLKDTKWMCYEGGCGSCVVAATIPHPVTKRKRTLAVNSCLVSVLSCHGWEIQIVHGLGNSDIGYHPIQKKLAEYNGSQCGFCSGGMIMNMYALTQKDDMLTMQDIEDSFGGNLCRCTGYRPILSTFKSLTTEAETTKICPKTGIICENPCTTVDSTPVYVQFDAKSAWYKVYSIQNILDIFKANENKTYRLVAGNTGHGVYKITVEPDYWIYITSVPELISHKIDTNLILGANVALSDTMAIMSKVAKEFDGFWFLEKVAKHIDLVAHVAVRNIGTIAGNLSLKHDHHEFPSDIFLLLETIGAKLTIVAENGSEVEKTVQEFINFDMNHCVLKSVTIYPLAKDTHLFESYKICPRVQNAHAYVNAGFLIEHDGNFIVKSARIVYGGINPDFVYAQNTEEYLVNKNLFTNETIQGALEKLDEELKPDYILPDATPEFRKMLAMNLFYKFILASADKSKVNPKYQSGEMRLERTLSTGTQEYQTDKKEYPVSKPVHKVEALIQCSESDKLDVKNLSAHYSFYRNNYAINAADKVKVTYGNSTKKPEYTIKDVLKDKNSSKIQNVTKQKAKRKGHNTKHVIKGEFSIASQYHFHMELQSCLCVPTDDGGYDIFPATQWINHVQLSAAIALNKPANKFNVIVKRLGGAYGGKILRANMVSTACVVAAHKLKRPVHVNMTLTQNMKALGKRMPCYGEFEVGVDDKGVIQYMDNIYYSDVGTAGVNEEQTSLMAGYMRSAYNNDTWKLNGNLVSTDMPGNCFCRAPGSSEAIAIIETIMDQISYTVDLDPLQVRQANLEHDQNNMPAFIKDMLKYSDYEKWKKEVEDFNSKNRWMKRGLSFVLMNYHFDISGQYSVFVAVFAGDGTVGISHGGIECGQGINTKVIQVCAYMFDIPMDMISVKPSNELNAPNNLCTGGSIPSEAICYGIVKACKEILQRLEPVRKKMHNSTWKELVLQGFRENVELCATHLYSKDSPDVKPYDILGACVTEVQVDILTGEHNILRVDLIEDLGQSMNPYIDVGQIEGAFVMGLGYQTCESLIYDENGQLLTNSTWSYKVPGVKDIPANFRIKFRPHSNNPAGVLNSKAVAEPPLCLAVSVPLAIRRTLADARINADPKAEKFIQIEGPTTVEFYVQWMTTRNIVYKICNIYEDFIKNIYCTTLVGIVE